MGQIDDRLQATWVNSGWSRYGATKCRVSSDRIAGARFRIRAFCWSLEANSIVRLSIASRRATAACRAAGPRESGHRRSTCGRPDRWPPGPTRQSRRNAAVWPVAECPQGRALRAGSLSANAASMTFRAGLPPIRPSTESKAVRSFWSIPAITSRSGNACLSMLTLASRPR